MAACFAGLRASKAGTCVLSARVHACAGVTGGSPSGRPVSQMTMGLPPPHCRPVSTMDSQLDFSAQPVVFHEVGARVDPCKASCSLVPTSAGRAPCGHDSTWPLHCEVDACLSHVCSMSHVPPCAASIDTEPGSTRGCLALGAQTPALRRPQAGTDLCLTRRCARSCVLAVRCLPSRSIGRLLPPHRQGSAHL